MKRVLLTGVNSYIGKNLTTYLQQYNELQGKEMYQVTCISQRQEDWKEYDFSGYDVVVDVTGIATVDERKLSKKEEEQYYSINSILACETAQKAKREGVKQFIYFSSILVYGGDYSIGKTECITKSTQPHPTNVYGKSKRQAEEKLSILADEAFKVAIIRLPFVYGAECNGGYRLLSRWAKVLPLISTISEEKSMIYIENLNEFLRLLIDAGEGGIYFPQNATRESVERMMEMIRITKDKKTYRCSLLNPMIKLLSGIPGKYGAFVRKVFGGLSYDLSMSDVLGDYRLVGFEESIRRTEEKGNC